MELFQTIVALTGLSCLMMALYSAKHLLRQLYRK